MKNLVFTLLLCMFGLIAANSIAAAPDQPAVQTINTIEADNPTGADAPAAIIPDAPVEKKSFIKSILNTVGLDTWGIINLILGLVALAFGALWALGKKKIKQAGELLIAVADAIEDKKIDANERTDLAERARALLSKT